MVKVLWIWNEYLALTLLPHFSLSHLLFIHSISCLFHFAYDGVSEISSKYNKDCWYHDNHIIIRTMAWKKWKKKEEEKKIPW